MGYNRVMMDGVVIEESDTAQCCHCNNTMFLDQKVELPKCWHCGKEHCLKDECFVCVAYMRKIDQEEAIARSRLLLWRAADNV